ncbi:NAD(+)/NADH kinase [Candidatus Woesearchaeota archaeon]|nr:NAD(+)/NADH kinase [Candidatus Woesearchaeota archaeon]
MTILVVSKKSLYELYNHSPEDDARQYVQKHEADLKASHERQVHTLETVLDELQKLGLPAKEVYRAHLPEEDLSMYELVIPVGGDGTLLEVSHYVRNTPLLGVNSDPLRSVGFFCAATRKTIGEVLRQLEQTPRTLLHRLQLVRNGTALPEPVLNDVLFAHTNPGANTRFTLDVGGKQQEYRGSGGLLACTAAGSTAWMWQLGGKIMPLYSQELQYKVRDARGEDAYFADELQIISQCREGRLYIDGEHLQHDLGLDQTLEIRAGTPLTVMGDIRTKRDELFS